MGDLISKRWAKGGWGLLLLATIMPVRGDGKEPLGPEWKVVGEGDWCWTRDYFRCVKQGHPTGSSSALLRTLSVQQGAWRCWVEPALGTRAAGLWFQVNEDCSRGFRCVLGGNPPAGGLQLQDAAGEILWQDEGAPWRPYQAYILEGIVEPGQVRIQLLEGSGALVSQSPWIAVPAAATEQDGSLGLFTEGGIARFWNWAHEATPLSPLTEDAPNKRRLVQGPDSEWTIVGPGNWMWTTGDHRWVRQYAITERSSAINRALTGALTTWHCRILVSPGSGGAGLLFQTDEQAQTGFLAWLGGNWGDGGLMLYRLPIQALWSSEQGVWHYDTEYVLQATTRPGAVQVQMYQADGQTLIVESPWIEVPAEETARVGALGFMCWKGPAQFADFGLGTAVAAAPGPVEPAASTEGPAPGWKVFGAGSWELSAGEAPRLRQTAAVAAASALAPAPAGDRGLWRVRVKIPPGTGGAGLLFQADADLREGFLCLLEGPPEKGSLKLQNLAGRTLWQNGNCPWQYDTEYVLEGHVETDRVRVRLLAADGQTVLSECTAVYVSERNNHRRGTLGFTTRQGPAEFRAWELQPTSQ